MVNLVPDIFAVDLESGLLSRVIADTGEVIETTIEDLSGGRLSIQGTIIRDIESGRIVSNLSLRRTNYIEQLGSGELLQQRPKSLAELNSSLASDGMDAVSFSYSITLPDGREFGSESTVASVTPISGIVIVRSGEHGTLEFGTLIPDLSELTSEILNMPEGWRVATPDEATQRAMVGYLMNTARDELDIIAGARIQDDEGNFLESAYEVAHFIAKTGLFDIVGLQLRQL